MSRPENQPGTDEAPTDGLTEARLGDLEAPDDQAAQVKAGHHPKPPPTPAGWDMGTNKPGYQPGPG
jgi:hypothetical protein